MMTSFRLQPHLDALTAAGRRLACTSETPDALLAWQREVRGVLRHHLRLGTHTAGPVRPERLGVVPRQGYREEQWRIGIDEGVSVNVYLLRPEEAREKQPVLVMHGHHPNVQYCIGNFPDAETREQQLAKDGHYAQALAQSGHLVCAVEQRGFGERVSGSRGQDPGNPWTCRHLFLHYLHHGRCLQGERVWDAMRVLDWFLDLPEVDAEGLACTGNSGGGSTTLYLAALDERVRIAVPASAFSSYEASILSRDFSHCLCNYVPGLGRDLEGGDVAALIAPRPLCLVNGEADPIFPAAAAREQFETVADAYAAAGAPDACRLQVMPGGHRFHVPVCLDWLARWNPLPQPH
jgi:dienelactone hydrolase